jgi:AraC-like DNA-binding protein
MIEHSSHDHAACQSNARGLICSNSCPLKPSELLMIKSELVQRISAGNSHLYRRDGGMSVRTLSRRLSKEDLKFAEVLEQLRSDLALRYLGEPSLSISQIAWLVGYNGVSSFSHACKRWTGMNPVKMRDQLRLAGH